MPPVHQGADRRYNLSEASGSFTFEENDDGMTCSGLVEFDGVDTAKAAIEKYDGMDMGLGNAITLEPQ